MGVKAEPVEDEAHEASTGPEPSATSDPSTNPVFIQWDKDGNPISATATANVGKKRKIGNRKFVFDHIPNQTIVPKPTPTKASSKTLNIRPAKERIIAIAPKTPHSDSLNGRTIATNSAYPNKIAITKNPHVHNSLGSPPPKAFYAVKTKVCEICKEEFKTMQAYNNHYNLTHTGKLFNCQHCDYKTNNKSNLKQHIGALHEGRRYPCKYCDMTLTAQASLKKHVFSKHLDIIDQRLKMRQAGGIS